MNYELPRFLEGVVSQEKYVRWLDRKARAHLNRDRKLRPDAKYVDYKKAIHKAVVESHGKDAYTGQQLNWRLISKWDNKQAKELGSLYKAKFAELPSVDHVSSRRGASEFAICSWRTNDAKNDMTVQEFVSLCKKIVNHFGEK